jgi:hypothetical protein
MNQQPTARRAVHLAQDPLHRGRFGSLLHLGEGGVVLLKAVLACEIARQRWHQRQVHRPRDALCRSFEKTAQSQIVLGAVAHQDALFREQGLSDRLFLSKGRRTFPALHRLKRQLVDANVVITDHVVEDVLACADALIRQDKSGQPHEAVAEQRRCQHTVAVGPLKRWPWALH